MVAGWNWIFEPGGHKSSGYNMLSGQWSPSQECEIGNEECFGAATVPTRTCSCILSARFTGKGWRWEKKMVETLAVVKETNSKLAC